MSRHIDKYKEDKYHTAKPIAKQKRTSEKRTSLNHVTGVDQQRSVNLSMLDGSRVLSLADMHFLYSTDVTRTS